MDSVNLITTKDSDPQSRAERLKRVRNLANLSRKQLCEESDININTLKGWEIGRYGGLTRKGAEKIIEILKAKGVNCSADWLMDKIGEGPRLIPESGVLQSNIPSESSENESEKIIREILFFRENNANAITYVIEDDGMTPVYQKGEYVAGIQQTTHFDAAIGHDCIIQTIDGQIFLRRLRRGNQPSRYTLICTNTQTTLQNPIIYDAALISAAPVIWHRKKNPIKPIQPL